VGAGGGRVEEKERGRETRARSAMRTREQRVSSVFLREGAFGRNSGGNSAFGVARMGEARFGERSIV